MSKSKHGVPRIKTKVWKRDTVTLVRKPDGQTIKVITSLIIVVRPLSRQRRIENESGCRAIDQ